MRISLKIYFLIFIFFILTTYNVEYKNKANSIFFSIKKIQIENNIATNLLKLKGDLNFFINKSLLFLDEEKILEIVNKHKFISNIQLKKKYPNTLKIIIKEKIPVAIQVTGLKKFYITKDNEKIEFISLKIYEDLPVIFGNYKNFNIFYNNLKKNYFKVNEIKAFYYFDVGRWDIVLKNEKIIKFPEKNYLDLLPKIISMIEDSNFSKYKVFDLRIKDQLILK